MKGRRDQWCTNKDPSSLRSLEGLGFCRGCMQEDLREKNSSLPYLRSGEAAIMSVSKTSKLLQFINYRMRITIIDSRQFIGRFLAFDRHFNLVLADAEEYRKLPPKKGKTEADREERRVLGLLLLRGDEVVSLTIEGPPPTEELRAQKGQVAGAGPGLGRAAGRGLPVAAPGQAPTGLAGPARGVGGPTPGSMLPRAQVTGAAVMRPPQQPAPAANAAPAASAPQQFAPGPRPGGPPQQIPRPGGPPQGFRPQQGQNQRHSLPARLFASLAGQGPPQMFRPGMMPPGFRPGMAPPGGPPPGFRPGMPPPGQFQGQFQGRPYQGPPGQYPRPQ